MTITTEKKNEVKFGVVFLMFIEVNQKKKKDEKLL